MNRFNTPVQSPTQSPLRASPRTPFKVPVWPDVSPKTPSLRSKLPSRRILDPRNDNLQNDNRGEAEELISQSDSEQISTFGSEKMDFTELTRFV